MYYGNNWVGSGGGEYLILGVGVFTMDNGGSGTRYVVPSNDTSYGAATGITSGAQLYMPSYGSLPAWFKTAFSQAAFEAAVDQMKADNPGLASYSIKYDYVYEEVTDFSNGVPYVAQRVGGLGRDTSQIVGYVYYAYEHAATPTPMAQADYCGEVVGASSDLEAFNEMLPVIAVGEATCTGVSEFTIPLSQVPFFGWDDINIPGAELCFEPVSLGTVTLLGVVINLDSILFIIGAVAVLLWFLRS
jgi:hypothetical protein